MVLPTLDQWLTFLALKSIGQLFFGRGFNMDYVSPGLAAEILLGIGVLLVLLNRRQPAWLWPTVVFAAFGGLKLLGSAARFLKNPLGFRPIENASRYFFLPRLLLIWCLLPHLRVHVGWRRWSLWALLALAALAAAADLSCRGLPRWPVGGTSRGVRARREGHPQQLSELADLSGAARDARRPGRGRARRDAPADHPAGERRAGLHRRGILFAASRRQGRPRLRDTPQGRAISGHYAASPGGECAVRFSVWCLPAYGGGTKLLWCGQLDPVHVPADRGAHDFEAALPPQALGRLLLTSQPASGGPVGGGCWAGIRFR